MPCGPHMVGRGAPDGRSAHQPPVRIAQGGPCLGPGRVEPRDDDRLRLRSALGWLAWAAIAVAVAATIVSAL
jgi:hypothetical protein